MSDYGLRLHHHYISFLLLQPPPPPPPHLTLESCHPNIIPSFTDLKEKKYRKANQNVTCVTGILTSFSHAGFLQSSNCHTHLHRPNTAVHLDCQFNVLWRWNPPTLRSNVTMLLQCDSPFIIIVIWIKAIFCSIFNLNLCNQLQMSYRAYLNVYQQY